MHSKVGGPVVRHRRDVGDLTAGVDRCIQASTTNCAATRGGVPARFDFDELEVGAHGSRHDNTPFYAGPDAHRCFVTIIHVNYLA